MIKKYVSDLWFIVQSDKFTDRHSYRYTDGQSDRLADGHISRRTYFQTDRFTDGHIYRRTYLQTDGFTDGHIYRRTYLQTDIFTDGHIYRRTVDRLAYGQSDRQTNRKTIVYIENLSWNREYINTQAGFHGHVHHSQDPTLENYSLSLLNFNCNKKFHGF